MDLVFVNRVEWCKMTKDKEKKGTNSGTKKNAQVNNTKVTNTQVNSAQLNNGSGIQGPGEQHIYNNIIPPQGSYVNGHIGGNPHQTHQIHGAGVNEGTNGAFHSQTYFINIENPGIPQGFPIMSTGMNSANIPIGQCSGPSNRCEQYVSSSINAEIPRHTTPGNVMQGYSGPNGQNTNYSMFEMIKQIQQTNMSFLNRLSSIEDNVSRLGSIQQEIGIVRNEVSNLKIENSTMTKKVCELETSCQSISGLFDKYIESKMKTELDIRELQRDKAMLESKLKIADQNYTKLSDELQEVKARSMQENLLFFGLCENATGENENTEYKLREFLKNELDLNSSDEVDSIQFDRVHRIGRRRANGVTNPRPIVAKFERFRDREKIRLAGIELNKKRTRYTIREQYPAEMETKRKRLYPVMRRYQKNTNNKVSLVRDKLYVNGLLYSEEKGELVKSLPNLGTVERPSVNYVTDRKIVKRRSNSERRSQVTVEDSNYYEVLQDTGTPKTSESSGVKRKPTSPTLDQTLTKKPVHSGESDSET